MNFVKLARAWHYGHHQPRQGYRTFGAKMTKAISALLHPPIIGVVGLMLCGAAQANISVDATTTPGALQGALQGAGVTINSATVVNGNTEQFGVYSGFSGSVINMPNGIVMSSGRVVDTAVSGAEGNTSTSFDSGSTVEYNKYGLVNVTNLTGDTMSPLCRLASRLARIVL